MQCERNGEDEAGWDALTAPLLQTIVQLALGGNSSLPFGRYLWNHDSRAAAQATHDAIVTLSLVCRRWREAVQAVLQQGSWRVLVESEAAAAAHGLCPLRALALSHLDVRLLSRREWPAAADEVANLLRDPGFQRRSAATLRVLLGLPERCAAALALAPFAALEVVGLVEDYASTRGKSHVAPMQLGALAALPRLRRLQLEGGVAELAALPPRVAELALLEIDRLALPPAPGASVVDRLLAAAEARGLSPVSVQSAAGCLVFEEGGRAPLELELPHVARLAAAHAPRWHVALSVAWDPALLHRAPRLDLTFTGMHSGGRVAASPQASSQPDQGPGRCSCPAVPPPGSDPMSHL